MSFPSVWFLTLASFLTLISCGNDSSKQSGDGGASVAGPANTTSEQPMTLVLDAGALPACGEGNNNQLVYVKDLGQFQVCSAGAWSAIDIKGPKGDAGAAGTKGDAGVAGAKGEAGVDGTDNRIISNIYCSGDLEDSPFDFTFDANLMASGDVLVTGAIRDSEGESTATIVYSAKQNGASKPSVYIRSDVISDSNYGFWVLELNRQTLVTTITYIDDDATSGQVVWTMLPTQCMVNDF